MSSDDGLLSFLRGTPDGSHYLVAINLTSAPIQSATAEFSNYFFNYGESTDGWSGEIVFGGKTGSEGGFTTPFTGAGQGQVVENISLPAYSVKIVAFDRLSTSINDEEQPNRFELRQNYPNPFNPSTTISFYLPQPEEVTLSVYDITGRQVTTLIDRPMNAGSHTQTFNASSLSSGMYFYRIEAGDFRDVQKMMLVK